MFGHSSRTHRGGVSFLLGKKLSAAVKKLLNANFTRLLLVSVLALTRKNLAYRSVFECLVHFGFAKKLRISAKLADEKH